MEAVCHGKRWDVAIAHDDRGTVIGALPYLIGVKMGLRYILQPQLTQYNGPWYRSDNTEERHNADIQFIAHLKHLRLTLFQQNFAPGVSDLEGWKGYTVAPRVTYRLEDISDPQRVFEGFDKSRRQRQIRRAERTLKADHSISSEEFARFHTDYWRSRGQKDLLTEEFMVRVINAALEREQGVLLGVRDSEGTLQGARFVAFDANCGYALLSALHPGHPNGTSALLFWLIMQELSGRCQSFDFEGSMDPGIALSYSLYGAQPTTYYQLTRWAIPLLRKLMKI
jgi:hypothetical protein